MHRRYLPTGHISGRHAFVPILITLYANVVFVEACQLCIWNIATGTSTPMSFIHSNRLELVSIESDHNCETQTALNLKRHVEYPGNHIAFLPRQRRANQPLFMMFNTDSNNETSPSATDISSIDTLETLNNQTDFDPASFFDDLQRSGDVDANDSDQKENTMSEAMIGAIGFYKKVISPVLPPACRFVPTCSTYGIQAIKEFGPAKGIILIAWRILRCTPIGGKGYDPPKWPPVYYTFSSY